MATKTYEVTTTIHIDYICLVLFGLTFILPTVPVWYTIIEMIAGVILVGATVLGTFPMIAVMLKDIKQPVTLPFFTWGRLGGLAINAVILVSMFQQELDSLFAVYLIATMSFNSVLYIFTKKS